jgi:hypothetical protein
MRLSVIAVAVAAVPSLLAQAPIAPAPADQTPVQTPTPLLRAPVQRQRIRQAASPNPTSASAKAPEVPPETAVVTMEGLCVDKQAKAPCKTVITREDLDRFINAFAPEAGQTGRGREAVQYARTLAFSTLAEQQGLDKNAAVAKELEIQLKLVRMRFLATAFLQSLQQQTATVLGSEVERYYELHRDQFEQAQVSRIAIPIAVPTAAGRPLDRAAVQSEMEALRKRVVAGEDPNQVLREAYGHLQIQATPPPVNPVTMRRGNLQGDEAKAFDLNPGEITPVLDLPAAFAIIKLDSKTAMPLESVRPELEAALRRDRIQNQIGKFGKRVTAEFNLPYLEMTSQPDLFGASAVNPIPARANRARAKAH